MAEKIRIGLVMKSLQADFFKAMISGAKSYAAVHPDIDLLCVGTASQTEVEEQIAMTNRLIDNGAEIIVLVPIDSKLLVKPAIRAVKKNITVVNIDIKLDEAMLAEAGVDIAFVGPDNYSASYEVSKILARKLRPGDEVAVIEGLPSADNALQRKEGAYKAIREFGLKMMASIPADWETGTAQTVFSSIWNENPCIKGVFCGNDAMALGVLKEMEARNRFFPVCGFDNDETVRPYLNSGKLVATADIFSSRMAVNGIEFAIDVHNNKAANEGIIFTPFEIISAE